jgi:hypothetical protein
MLPLGTKPFYVENCPLMNLCANLTGDTLLPNLSRRLQTHGSVLDLVDPVLTTQAMLATTEIGMWKRNGVPIEGQGSILQNSISA